MGSARQRTQRQPARLPASAGHLHPAGERRPCLGRGDRHPFASGAPFLAERRIDGSAALLRYTGNQRPIELPRFIGPESLAQAAGRFRRSRQDQYAGRIAIQTMNKAGTLIRAEPEGVEHAVEVTVGATAALDGEARRLVDRDYPVIPEKHARLESLAVLLAQARLARRRGRVAG